MYRLACALGTAILAQAQAQDASTRAPLAPPPRPAWALHERHPLPASHPETARGIFARRPQTFASAGETAREADQKAERGPRA
eukprot:12933182-Prorocentrum_lima.AAC.1